MIPVFTKLRECRLARSLATSVLALVLACGFVTAARAQENPDITLQGVSRSFIQANGHPANGVTVASLNFNLPGVSARGSDQVGAQLPRSGFDLVSNGTEGVVYLPGLRTLPNGTCNNLTDAAYFLVHVAGRPGDADGDGVFNLSGQGGINTCGSRRGNIPSNPFPFDGNPGDKSLLSQGENVRIKIFRNCSYKAFGAGAQPDLEFSLTDIGSQPTQLQADFDNILDPGGAPKLLGGEGASWEAGVFTVPATAFAQPCPTQVDGYYLIRIPNWSSYFAAKGLNPGDFAYIVSTGSDDDGVGEDLIAGELQLTQPNLSITKTPDLTLCPGDQGTYTIHVSNDGNGTLRNIVVTDVLPADGTIVTSSIPASGASGTVTFGPFDLAQCEAKDITVTVKASDQCHGNEINTATADGIF